MESVGNTVVASIMSYFLGLISGFFLHEYMRRKNIAPEGTSGNLFVLVMVTTMWAFSVIYDIVNPEYTTSPLIHGLMGAIVGFFYKPIGGKGK